MRIRQPLATLKKHTNYISSVAFSHLGDLLATSAGDNLVILWNTRSWEAVASFNECMAPVTCSVFSPDDQMIISTSHDGWVRLWRPADQACRPVHPRTPARRNLPVRLSARPEREGTSQVVVKATQGPHRGHQWGCAPPPPYCCPYPCPYCTLTLSLPSRLRVLARPAHGRDQRPRGQGRAVGFGAGQAPLSSGAAFCIAACPPPPPPRTKWTRRVPHPVLSGHAASPDLKPAGPQMLLRNKELMVFEGHGGPVLSCGFSPNSARVFSCSADRPGARPFPSHAFGCCNGLLVAGIRPLRVRSTASQLVFQRHRQVCARVASGQAARGVFAAPRERGARPGPCWMRCCRAEART